MTQWNSETVKQLFEIMKLDLYCEIVCAIDYIRNQRRTRPLHFRFLPCRYLIRPLRPLLGQATLRWSFGALA